MLLAEHITLLVLALEMKHVDSKDHSTEKGVLLLVQMSLQATVVVEKNHIW